jgi:Putative zinc-finger
MSSVAGCREIRHSLGVYVLGAIDPADRVHVEDHLVACLDCREELAGLAGLPALLRRVPTAEAERMTRAGSVGDVLDDAAMDHMLPCLIERTTQIRRSRRVHELVAAAAVVVLVLGVGAAGATIVQGTPVADRAEASRSQVHQADTWQLVSASNARTGATLTMKYRPMPWGTMMTASVAGIAPGTVCQLQITDLSGHRWVVGGWRVGNYRGGPVWYSASASLADAHLHAFADSWWESSGPGRGNLVGAGRECGDMDGAAEGRYRRTNHAGYELLKMVEVPFVWVGWRWVGALGASKRASVGAPQRRVP